MEQKTILIVEDETINAMAMKSYLETKGYAIIKIIKSGEEAIEYLQDNSPSLILMDIFLADKISGIDVINTVYKCKEIPVIFITACNDIETMSQVKKMPNYHLISKPFNFESLENEIHAVIYSK